MEKNSRARLECRRVEKVRPDTGMKGDAEIYQTLGMSRWPRAQHQTGVFTKTEWFGSVDAMRGV